MSDSTTTLTDPPAAGAEECVRQLTRRDFQTDQEVRWCPGCGDYVILAQVQKVLARKVDIGTSSGAHSHITGGSLVDGAPSWLS